MSQIADIQDLVLTSLGVDDQDQRGLAELFDGYHRFSNNAVLTALSEARDNISDPGAIFHAALLYHNNNFAWDTRESREQKREAFRLLLLLFDFQEGIIDAKTLDNYLRFLETRMEIRFFAQEPARAIAYIDSIYGDISDLFLARLTYSKAATIKRWRSGQNNPTKMSKQIIASVAEILYQLYEIKGFDEKRTIAWFEKWAQDDLIRNNGWSYVFSPSLEKRMRALDLVPIGVNLWV